MADTIELINRQLSIIPSLRDLPSAERPEFKQWDQTTRAIIEKRLGKKRADGLTHFYAYWPNHMGPWDDHELKECLLSGLATVEAYLKGLLEEIELLGEENPSQGSQPSGHSKNASYGNITVSGGTLIMGDGNRINQVAVKELVQALQDEIEEKVTEGENKQSILKSLKEITTNESFAAVASTFIGEILRRVVVPGFPT